MATYTMQLRDYIEQATQFENPYNWEDFSHQGRIEQGRRKLFDFHYPIFDEEYRVGFETRIIRHFYMREIGFETEGLFKFALETKLNEIMPYYNKLFESERIKFNPLINTKLKTDYEKKNNKDQTDNTERKQDTDTNSNTDRTQDTKNTSETDTSQKTDDKTKTNSSNDTDTNYDDFTRNVTDNTPDDRLKITTNDGKGVIEYASNIDESDNSGKSDEKQKGEEETTYNSDLTSDVNYDGEENITGDEKYKGEENVKGNTDYTSEIKELEDYLQWQEGKSGTDSYSTMLMEYRATFLRIESDIFRELQELFMLVYG